MISIIIPTYNREQILKESLFYLYHAIKNYDFAYELIIINDGQEINTNNPGFKSFSIYKNPGKGVASARNYGVRISKFENILFIDDDILFSSDNISDVILFVKKNYIKENCLNFIIEYPDDVYKLSEKNNFIRFLTYVHKKSNKNFYKILDGVDKNFFLTANLSSCALLMSKQNFYKVGGYNETFPYSGFEDYFFFKKVKENNINIICSRKVVYHNEKDNLSYNKWKERRIKEGITRFVYVKLSDDNSYVINPSLIKRIIFRCIIIFNKPLYLFCRILYLKIFDWITFFVYSVIAGAYIWRGYRYYEKKQD